MKKKLNYSFVLTLKEIALRRIAIYLCCHPTNLTGVGGYGMEYKALLNLNELKLPSLLEEEVKYLIKPIGSEIRNFKWFHEKYLTVGRINMFYILKQLRWTVLGTVDYQKTAEVVVHLEMLSIVKRYRLACLYCLDEYIPILWEKLPEEYKKYYYSEGPLGLHFPELEFCWPYILKGEETKLDFLPLNPFGEPTPFNQHAFEYSAYKGNKAAAEYFFRKLPCDVREDSLSRIAEEVSIRRFDGFDKHYGEGHDNFPEENISDVFCFLSSLMKHEQQMIFFKDHPFEVLLCVLDWPRQDLFSDIVEFTSDLLTNEDYSNLLHEITSKIESGYYLAELFRDFFLRCSRDVIKEVVEMETWCGSILHGLFKFHDLGTIKVIFGKLDSIDKMTFISYEVVYKLFWKSILIGYNVLVELCLQQAALSKTDIEKLKNTYAEFLPEDDSKEDRRSRKYLCTILDDLADNPEVNIPKQRQSNRVRQGLEEYIFSIIIQSDDSDLSE